MQILNFWKVANISVKFCRGNDFFSFDSFRRGSSTSAPSLCICSRSSLREAFSDISSKYKMKVLVIAVIVIPPVVDFIHFIIC